MLYLVQVHLNLPGGAAAGFGNSDHEIVFLHAIVYLNVKIWPFVIENSCCNNWIRSNFKSIYGNSYFYATLLRFDGCRETFKALVLLNWTSMEQMHGYFLLHVNHTHGKVCFYSLRLSCHGLAICTFHMYKYKLGAHNTKEGISRSPETFSWCSSIFFHQDHWAYPTYDASSKNVVCGKCCWVWGLYTTFHV